MVCRMQKNIIFNMKSRLEWKVGLFVLIGLVLLAALLIQFSKGTTFLRGKTYEIVLRSINVGGLKKGASVLMAGVEVGKVGDIRMAPDGKTVTITLKVYSAFVIHKDALFKIEQAGFLGDQYVAIMPTQNEGPLFKDGEEAPAEPPLDMQEVARAAAGFLVHVDETAKRLNDSIADLRRFLFNPETLSNVAVVAVNLRAFSEQAVIAAQDIQTLLATNSPAIAQSASNIVAFSRKMNNVAAGLGEVISTNSDNIHQIVRNLESTSETLTNIMADLHAGKGLAGNLLQNEQLATNISLITSNLTVTTSNLNRLGLWGILWQHKPPKASAPRSKAPESLSAPKESGQ